MIDCQITKRIGAVPAGSARLESLARWSTPSAAHPTRAPSQQARGSSSGSSGTQRSANGLVDSVLTLISVGLVVAAALFAIQSWIEPGWPTICVLALLFWLTRAFLLGLFGLRVPGERLTSPNRRLLPVSSTGGVSA